MKGSIGVESASNDQSVAVKPDQTKRKRAELCENSLFLFSKSNPVRLCCIRIIDSRAFSAIVLSLIIGNCVFLALSQPFGTCCTAKDLQDPAVEVVNAANFSYNCDSTNTLNRFEAGHLIPLQRGCCLVVSETDEYNKCAQTTLRVMQENAEVIFNLLFSVEMSIKIIALGFISGKAAYIRDWWNILDFIVVAVGWLSMIPGIANFSALRTFRVLRPLRTLSSIPGMRPIVTALISCVKSMVHVIMLCMFLFTVFGIIGLQLFSGTLKGRCHYIDYTSAQGLIPADGQMKLYEADGMPCPLPCNTKRNSLGEFDYSPWTRSSEDCLEPNADICAFRGKAIIPNPVFDPEGKEGEILSMTVSMPDHVLAPLDLTSLEITEYAEMTSTNYTQKYNTSKPYTEVLTFCFDTGENQLGDGYANFDNIGYAWLTIFTSITLEGWTDVMYGIQAAFGYSFVVFFYFFLMVWLCSFFMLELTLAVINDAYDQAAEEEAAEHRRQGLEAVYSEVQDHAPDTTEAKLENLEALRKDQELERKREEAMLKPWGPPLVQRVFHLVESSLFQNFVTLLIVFNTVTLAMEHYGMSKGLKNFLEESNMFFTIAFLIEMILKLVGLGPRQYARDPFNIFDFFIVSISVIELVVETEDGGSGSGLGALRSFRLMRVFKLARSWKNLRRLLSTIVLSVMDVANAAVLLVIIMFIFTLLGMQMFGGQWTAAYFCEDPEDYDLCKAETPRPNFDTFFWGFVTVFQILTGENWNEVMYIGKRVNGEISWIYFVCLNLIGNYMVLNLFLAILLARFENTEEEEEEEEGMSSGRRIGSAAVAPMPMDSNDKRDGEQGNSFRSNRVPQTEGAGNREFEENEESEEDSDEHRTTELPKKNPNKMKMNPHAKAFFLLPPEMPLRQHAFAIVNSGKFENGILVLIFISTILLALEEPWVQECKDTTCKGFFSFLFTMDIILNVFFIMELLLKVLALGFVGHRHSYLRNGWNILDFIIVCVSITSMALTGDSTIKALKSLRSLRALRPLRVISRSPGMRLVVNAIIAAIPAIANVTVVVILFMLIFAIIGVQNFSGGLNGCNDPDFTGLPHECNSSTFWIPQGETCSVLPTDALIEECLRNGTGGCETCFNGGGFPRVWGPNGGFPNSYNFDDVGQSLLVVFEVVTGEMWPDIMYSTMDIDGMDLPLLEWPHRQNTSVAWWYIMVTLVCSFLMINVFVGVIIDNFNQMKDLQNGSSLLTDEQKVWLEMMKNTLNEKPIRKLDPPSNPLRRKAFDLVQSSAFEVTIMSIILLNTFTMMLGGADMSFQLNKALEIVNFIFLAIFTVEAVVKVFGLGLRNYVRSAWNCFDGSLAVLGWLGVAGGLGPLASLLRIFRVARIFRLVRTSEGLLTIFRTLIYSVPSMMNVGGIFCLLMLIYSILGMNLFSSIKFGEFLNEEANFKTFWGSMALLFRVSTGESFNGIMHDCMIQAPYCDPDGVGNCGFPVFAPLYFTSYVLLSSYTLLSMITAIILDNFNDNTAMSHNVVTTEHVDAFKQAWSRFDPKGTMLLPERLLVKLVQEVPYPLGVKNTPDTIAKGKSKRKLANQLIRSIDIPTLHGNVSFSDVLTELTTQAMPDIEIPEEHELIMKIKDQKSSHQNKMLKKMGTSTPCLYSAAQVSGIMLIQSSMRGFIQRRKLEDLANKITQGIENHMFDGKDTPEKQKECPSPPQTTAVQLPNQVGTLTDSQESLCQAADVVQAPSDPVDEVPKDASLRLEDFQQGSSERRVAQELVDSAINSGRNSPRVINQ